MMDCGQCGSQIEDAFLITVDDFGRHLCKECAKPTICCVLCKNTDIPTTTNPRVLCAKCVQFLKENLLDVFA